MKEKEIVQFIISTPLFLSVPAESIKELAPCFEVCYYTPDDIIIREGDEADSFFILTKGHVKVTIEIKGRISTISRIEPPEGFGELALLLNSRRTASVTAEDDVETLKLSRDDFFRFIQHCPDFLISITNLLNTRVSLIADRAFLTEEERDSLVNHKSLNIDFMELDNLNKLNMTVGPEQVMHCKETAILVKEMCNILCPQIADDMVYAGLLHEIGKIAIDAELIEKQRRGCVLSPEEEEVFSEIYNSAMEIISPNRELLKHLEFIRYLSGRDYKAMPIKTQILKVADDYEELINPHYRNLSRREAFDIIKSRVNRCYNPKVVMALEKVVENFSLISVERQIRFIKHINMALNQKDNYTLRHSIHTRNMALEIAKEMNLTRSECDTLRIASELHDVGKIHISRDILNAPRKLTPIEVDVMRKHPLWSHDYFREIPGMADIANSVRWHHEKFNGTGYPDGLKKEKIPFFARIISVADVFSALTTKRPYKESLPYPDSLSIMSSMEGSFFPDIFSVFEKIVNRKIEIQRQKALCKSN